MHPNSVQIFTELAPILVENEEHLIIPMEVIEEIKKHLHSSDVSLKKQAGLAIKVINDYIHFNIAQIQGEKENSFADNVFISVFTKFRLKYNLCLITQDNGLSQDIMNLRKNSRSVRSIRKIKVIRISNEGKFEDFPNKKTAKVSANKTNKTNKTNKANKNNQTDKFKICKKPITINSTPLKSTNIPELNDIVTSKKYGSIKLIKEIARGGEGTAYLTNNNLVCKIYKKEKLTKNKLDKLNLMLHKPINKKGICWPKDLVYNAQNEFVGFLMDKADGAELQKTVFMPMLLRKKFPNWKRYNLVKLSDTILSLISYLHDKNVIIGDINPLNILVKSETEVYFIDTDSFQIENYPCTVGTINYTAPEIQNKDYKKFLRTFEHENFAVATLLFMILLPGKPPYSQQGGGNPSTNIKKQDFSYPLGDKTNKKTPPGQWRYIWSNLLYSMKEAFYNTFKEGKRLSVDEWHKLIKQYLYELDQNHVLHEIFPNHFKIVDPIEVYCCKCARKYIASKPFIADLKSHGKEPICDDCRNLFIKKSSTKSSNKKRKPSQKTKFSKNNTSTNKSGSINNNKSKKNNNSNKNNASYETSILELLKDVFGF